MIPFFSFDTIHQTLKAEIMAAIEAVYDAQWYIMGHALKNFEAEYAQYSGVKHCVGVGNGLDALVLSLKALGVGPGDEVIVPSHTFIATWLAVSMVGATPVPAEPQRSTFNLTADSVAKAITPHTKAMIVVHMYGHPCELTEILQFANEHQIYVIEDNAQAQGASFDGKMTGTFGDVNAVSFYPIKNLGALGDGGAVTTNSDTWADTVYKLRNYGSAVKYHNDIQGVNSRLDELQAAVLRVKLRHLDSWNEERIQIANSYKALLSHIEAITLPTTSRGAKHVFHQFVIRTPQRDTLQAWLKAKGIETLIHYPIPPHLQKAYQNLGYNHKDLPIAKELADTVLSLPIYPGLGQSHIEQIAGAIVAFYQ